MLVFISSSVYVVQLFLIVALPLLDRTSPPKGPLQKHKTKSFIWEVYICLCYNYNGTSLT